MADEKRLIDANALKELIFRRSGNMKDTWSSPAVLLAVECQPTVDAVEVVRCKGCKYGIEDHEDAYLCDNPFYGLMGFTRGDDFCSYGERKDNEHSM